MEIDFYSPCGAEMTDIAIKQFLKFIVVKPFLWLLYSFEHDCGAYFLALGFLRGNGSLKGTTNLSTKKKEFSYVWFIFSSQLSYLNISVS